MRESLLDPLDLFDLFDRPDLCERLDPRDLIDPDRMDLDDRRDLLEPVRLEPLRESLVRGDCERLDLLPRFCVPFIFSS